MKVETIHCDACGRFTRDGYSVGSKDYCGECLKGAGLKPWLVGGSVRNEPL